MKVATHVVFSESCLFCASAVLDFHYDTTSVLVTAVCSVLPYADYPKSWLGHHLGASPNTSTAASVTAASCTACSPWPSSPPCWACRCGGSRAVQCPGELRVGEAERMVEEAVPIPPPR